MLKRTKTEKQKAGKSLGTVRQQKWPALCSEKRELSGPLSDGGAALVPARQRAGLASELDVNRADLLKSAKAIFYLCSLSSFPDSLAKLEPGPLALTAGQLM